MNKSASTLAIAALLSAIFLLFVCHTAEGHALGHQLSKRSFFDIQCKGYYDKAIFAKLDRVCYDCYNLFREPEIHHLCRSNCFDSEFFKGCVDALMIREEFNELVEKLGKK